MQILRNNLEEYKKNWILSYHETKLLNWLYENNIKLQDKVNALEKRLSAFEDGKQNKKNAENKFLKLIKLLPKI